MTAFLGTIHYQTPHLSQPYLSFPVFYLLAVKGMTIFDHNKVHFFSDSGVCSFPLGKLFLLQLFPSAFPPKYPHQPPARQPRRLPIYSLSPISPLCRPFQIFLSIQTFIFFN